MTCHLKNTFNLFVHLNFKISSRKLIANQMCAMCTAKAAVLAPPECVKGMKVLNRDAFKKEISVPYLKVHVKNLERTSKAINQYLLKMSNFVAIKDLAEPDYKEVVLNPQLIQHWDDLSEGTRETLATLEFDKECLMWRDLTLGYENWKYDDVFKAILSEDRLCFSGFSVIGHVIHLNLRENLLPYRFVIGQVLLDKMRRILLVVNKTDIIETEFRNFKMEILAGEGSTVTKARENGCTFDLDFAKVYWNPRLCSEHERIIKLLNKGDYLFDVFAGIGPFAVPAGRKKCIVSANDLNPDSYAWLQKNVLENKVSKQVQTHNLDGRDFIKHVVKPGLMAIWNPQAKEPEAVDLMLPPTKIHIVMNLPALAVEFLDCFEGLCADFAGSRESLILPMVHVYSFVKYSTPDVDPKDAITEANCADFLLQKINENLNANMQQSEIKIHVVRKVAPLKEMFCISFDLSSSLLFRKPSSQKRVLYDAECQLPTKKICTIDNTA